VQARVVAPQSRSIDPARGVAPVRSPRLNGCAVRRDASRFFFTILLDLRQHAQGNIGPVADALAEALDAHKVMVLPRFPCWTVRFYQRVIFLSKTAAQ